MEDEEAVERAELEERSAVAQFQRRREELRQVHQQLPRRAEVAGNRLLQLRRRPE